MAQRLPDGSWLDVTAFGWSYILTRGRLKRLGVTDKGIAARSLSIEWRSLSNRADEKLGLTLKEWQDGRVRYGLAMLGTLTNRSEPNLLGIVKFVLCKDTG